MSVDRSHGRPVAVPERYEYDTGTCVALCGACMRAWRRFFDSEIGRRDVFQWLEGRGGVDMDVVYRLVQGGPDGDGSAEALAGIRSVVRSSLGIK